MQRSERKKKMLLVLPLLIIPFLTLAFYALGGGKGKDGEEAVTDTGLNAELPAANLKEEKLLDKLAFYTKADKDSAKRNEWIRNDPYYQKENMLFEDAPEELDQLATQTASKHNQRLRLSPYESSQRKPEEELLQKLQLLQRELNKDVSPDEKKQDDYTIPRSKPAFGNDVDRLETLMNQMSTGGEDPELSQLSAVMDKILNIQHPDRVLQNVKQEEAKEERILEVSGHNSDDTIPNGFNSMILDSVEAYNSIEAIVPENQVMVNGAVIKLKLQQDIYIKGDKIPSGNLLFGTVNLNGERLQITIGSIRHGSSIYPVKLDVYDLDGLPGIYMPGTITRDVVKQSADNSFQQIGLSSIDPSFKAQAATAGLSTAKNLLSRKTKLVKVMVKAGYHVLLSNKNIR